MSRSIAHLLVLGCTIGAMVMSVHANLSYQVSTAKSRARLYGQRYGAVDPIFRIDDKGIVVMECWAAPPEMWLKEVVQKFGAELLPTSLRSQRPKVLPKDGSEEAFLYSDGTRLILREFQGKYLGVEVRSPKYTGNRC